MKKGEKKNGRELLKSRTHTWHQGREGGEGERGGRHEKALTLLYC